MCRQTGGTDFFFHFSPPLASWDELVTKPGQLGLQNSSSDWDTGFDVHRLRSLLLSCKNGLEQTPEHTVDRKANGIHHLARDSGRAGCAGGPKPRGFSGLGILIFEMGVLIELWGTYGWTGKLLYGRINRVWFPTPHL